LKDAWDLPEFQQPNAFFSGQRLGTEYANLAAEVPPLWMNPYTIIAENKVNEVFLRAVEHYKQQGDAGLEQFVSAELAAAEDYVETYMARNVFAKQSVEQQ
jgi:hypothetical protein